MPRPLVLGNGSLLVGYDSSYAIRDLMYPQLGLFNHLNNSTIRLGVWTDCGFSWCDGEGWDRELGYDPDTMVGSSVLTHRELGIRLRIREAVLDQPVHLREIIVENLTEAEREVRLFFTQDLHIRESDIGDTAFYHPGFDGIVHFKQHYYFLFRAATETSGVYEYACGINGFGGLAGTWVDAEDGRLGMNAIAQGSVDSTFSVSFEVGAGESEVVHYSMVAASDMSQLSSTVAALSLRSVGDWLEESAHYWRERVAHVEKDLYSLPEAVIAMAKNSLVVMESQIDRGGAIIAATDSDIMKTNRANYAYAWPRDGAFVSMVANRAGLPNIARRFLDFCARVANSENPVLMQKYLADGSMGATWHPWVYNSKPDFPFQEDETASTILAMLDYYRSSRDLELLADFYRNFVRRAVEFMLEHRETSTKLPLASYDLWEERRGVHTFTVAVVISSLHAAAEMAGLLNEDGAVSSEAASEMTEGLQAHLFDNGRGVFYRRIYDDSGQWVPDRTVDSSVLHVGLEGVLPPDHPMVVSSGRVVEETLWVRSQIGGLARYEGDYYFRVSDDYPGNPWIITTMWLAQHKLLTASSLSDLDKPRELLEWALARRAPSGVLPEQVHPDTGEHLSVSPLTWSHAEVVKTCYEFCGGVKALRR